jgi:hypothetical protein
MTPLWFWQHTEHVPRVQVLKPPRVLGVEDPEIFAAGEEAGKSLARQRANEKRRQDAQLTAEELEAIADYAKRHPKPSKRQAENDLGIPRHKIKWPGPTP